MAYCTQNYCCAPDKCWLQGVLAISFSGVHKLCENHFNNYSGHTIICGHCESVCLINKDLVCQKSSKYRDKNFQSINTEPLPICPSKVCKRCSCSLSNSSESVCKNNICSDCAEKFGCCESFCTYCKTHTQVYSTECHKVLCQNCCFNNGCCNMFCLNCKIHKFLSEDLSQYRCYCPDKANETYNMNKSVLFYPLPIKYQEESTIVKDVNSSPNKLPDDIFNQEKVNEIEKKEHNHLQIAPEMTKIDQQISESHGKISPKQSKRHLKAKNIKLKTTNSIENFESDIQLKDQSINSNNPDYSQNNYRISPTRDCYNGFFGPKHDIYFNPNIDLSQEYLNINQCSCGKKNIFKILDCNHCICQDCYSNNNDFCLICYPKNKQCTICANFFNKTARFEKCEHVGCLVCNVNKICFMCITHEVFNTKVKPKCLKRRISCYSCKAIGKKCIKLICHHYVCLKCYSGANLFDYKCSECYFKFEKKLCVNCFKRYTIIGFDDNLVKDCCNLSLKIYGITVKCEQKKNSKHRDR